MAIQEVLILAFLALVLGWITRRFPRIPIFMTVSVLVFYWLQPGLTLRYLEFWLPTAALGITVLSWGITSEPAALKKSSNWISAGLLGVMVVLVWGLKTLGLDPGLLATRVPALWVVLLLLTIIPGCLLALGKSEGVRPAALWVGFGLLVGIFIVLKTPALARMASGGWRTIAGQNPELAFVLDIRWFGFSYLAFRLLHTIRDRQAGRLLDLELGEYVTYVVFFPAVTAGPIDRVERFVKDLQEVNSSRGEDVWAGGKRLAAGLFKKFVLADTLAMIALNATSALQARSSAGAWVMLYAYAFQILFDFSGYTDIAIGAAHFLGIHLPENFDRPYLKPNLSQFWNSWHITLTQWFRSYFFNPVSRFLRRQRRYAVWVILLLTQLGTMLLVGLWHGVTVNFVLWGVWHGAGLFLQNRWSAWVTPHLSRMEIHPNVQKGLDVVGIGMTFHYVALGWIWFALPNPHLSWQFLLRLLGVT